MAARSGSFSHARAAASAHDANARSTHARSEGGQPPAAGRRTMLTAYRWNEARQRWLRTSDALERLARETQERF